ncbi:MAG: hypothetical protein QXY90_06635 [Candidatus Anstonellales archaeon]
MPSRDYIVRVYRYNRKRPRSIIGIVEEVGVAEKKAFTNIDELWKILNPNIEPKKFKRKSS